MKVLFGAALQQITGFVERLIHLVNLDWTLSNFSTLSRRQKPLKVNVAYRASAGPLHLQIDSTGARVEGEGEWTEEGQKTVRGTVCPTKTQARRREASGLAQDQHPLPGRQMDHSPRGGNDEQTLEIQAAGFTTSEVGDAPVRPELLDRIPPNKRSPASLPPLTVCNGVVAHL